MPGDALVNGPHVPLHPCGATGARECAGPVPVCSSRPASGPPPPPAGVTPTYRPTTQIQVSHPEGVRSSDLYGDSRQVLVQPSRDVCQNLGESLVQRTVGVRTVTEREASVTYIAHSDRMSTFGGVSSSEPVLSQVAPADRSSLQDSMGLTVDQLLQLPGLAGTAVVGGVTGTRRIVRHV